MWLIGRPSPYFIKWARLDFSAVQGQSCGMPMTPHNNAINDFLGKNSPLVACQSDMSAHSALRDRKSWRMGIDVTRW
jgi:hypothetical protein